MPDQAALAAALNLEPHSEDQETRANPAPITVRPSAVPPGTARPNGNAQHRAVQDTGTAPSADQDDAQVGQHSAHGTVGVAGAPPRPAGKRHTMTRDPVADMMPTAGGFLRISVRGTDGKPSLINDYTAADMVGFPDVVQFINKVLRPTYGPFTGERDATYVVNRHDSQGNSVAVVHIPIAAPRGGLSGGLANGTSPGMDKASLLERKLIDSFETQQKETDAKFAKVIEVIKTVVPMGGAGGPAPGVNLAEIITSLKEVMKPDTSAMQAILSEIREDKRSSRRHREDEFEERSARSSAPAANPLAGLEGLMDPPKPTAQDEMMKMLLERALPANGGNVPAAPTNPLNDAIDLIVKLKTVFAPPVVTGPSAEVVELRAQVQRLTDKLDDTMNKGGPIQAKIAELKAMRELAEIFNPEGEKPSFMDYIPDITKGISDVAKAFAGRTPTVQTPRPGNASAARPGGNAAEPAPATAKPAEPVKVPVPAQHAILALRDAQPNAEDFDQQIVNSLFSLVSTLHGAGDPWKTKAGGILNRLKAANSYPEIQALLTDTLLACGAQKVINSSPGMIERCAVAIWRHYHEIHAAVWSEPRFLSDNPAGSYTNPEGQEGQAPVKTAKPPAASAAPGKGKGKKPAPAEPAASPAAPAPADEDEDEDEESDEEDDADGDEDADYCDAVSDPEEFPCALEAGHDGDHEWDTSGDEDEDDEEEEDEEEGDDSEET